ncbi:MAG TPA: permease [Elusimicrobia bacterium]|nr:permease [Elusimicrobiota bacterium]
MRIIFGLTFISFILSVFSDKKKTFSGIARGVKMFLAILPAILNVLILVSIFLFLVPQETIAGLLGKDSGFSGMMLAAVIGSISLIPAPISYPLAAVLVKCGVSYKIIAVFITTLMMVGVLTLPLEIKYFGVRVSLMRNALSFIGAIAIGALMGIFL